MRMLVQAQFVHVLHVSPCSRTGYGASKSLLPIPVPTIRRVDHVKYACRSFRDGIEAEAVMIDDDDTA